MALSMPIAPRRAWPKAASGCLRIYRLSRPFRPSSTGSLESRVLPTTRKFEQLDASKASKSIPELEGAGTTPRQLSAPELVSALAMIGGRDDFDEVSGTDDEAVA